MEPKFLSLENH